MGINRLNDLLIVVFRSPSSSSPSVLGESLRQTQLGQSVTGQRGEEMERIQ